MARSFALEPHLNQAFDALYRFSVWWKGTLLKTLPVRLSERMGSQIEPATLLAPTGWFDSEDGDENWLHVQQQNAGARIQIPDDRILIVERTFPLNVERNLRSAIALQIDHFVPMRKEEIAFDYEVRSRDKESEILHVTIAIVRQDDLDRLHTSIREKHLQISQFVGGVDNWSSQRLPVFWRAPVSAGVRDRFLLNLLLVILLALLVNAASWALEFRRDRQIAAWDDALRALQTDAIAEETLASQLTTLNLLSEETSTWFSTNLLLDRLSKLAPVLDADQIDLKNLKFTSNTIQLSLVADPGVLFLNELKMIDDVVEVSTTDSQILIEWKNDPYETESHKDDAAGKIQ